MRKFLAVLLCSATLAVGHCSHSMPQFDAALGSKTISLCGGDKIRVYVGCNEPNAVAVFLHRGQYLYEIDESVGAALLSTAASVPILASRARLDCFPSPTHANASDSSNTSASLGNASLSALRETLEGIQEALNCSCSAPMNTLVLQVPDAATSFIQPAAEEEFDSFDESSVLIRHVVRLFKDAGYVFSSMEDCGGNTEDR